MVRYCNHCGRAIPDETNWCSHCGKEIPAGQGIAAPAMQQGIPIKKDNTKLIIIIVIIIAVAVILIPIILSFAVYNYTNDMLGPEPINITPSVSLIAQPSPDDTICTITVGAVTESDVSWYDVDITLVDVSNSNEIMIYSSSWRPDDTISAGDSIIIDNADIYPDFTAGDQYRLTIEYMPTGGILGTVSWTQ